MPNRRATGCGVRCPLLVALLSALTSAGPAPAASRPVTSAPASAPAAIAASLTDAALRDVFFLDPQRGWVVGDDGTILRSEDGGDTWQRTPTATEASLDRVFFADARHGWAVGGESRRLSPGGFGVVLRTEDGGATWVRVVLPSSGWLHDVYFSDQTRGWARGDATPDWPTGLIATTNGGVTWRPVEEAAAPTAPLRRQGPPPTREPLPIHGLHFLDPDTGFAVGDLGLILRTTDGGRSWRAVHRGDDRVSLLVLLAGPGGYPWSLLARYAADEGYRAAVLDWVEAGRPSPGRASSRPTSAPATQTTKPAPPADIERGWSGRRETLRQACAAVAVPASAQVHAAGVEDLAAELVRAIRTWRPLVVLVATDPERPERPGGPAARNEQALQAAQMAFDRAGDEAHAPNLAKDFGLAPWQARRLLALAPEPDPAQEPDTEERPSGTSVASLPAKVFSPRLGETHSIVGLRAAERLRQRPATVMHVDRLRVVTETWHRPPEATAERLFLGVHVPPGTPGRRSPALVAAGQTQRAERLTQDVRNLWLGFLLARRQPRMSGFVSVAGNFARQHPETAEGAWALASTAEVLAQQGDFGSAYGAYEGLLTGQADIPGAALALFNQVSFLTQSVRDPRLALLLDPASYDRQRITRQAELENERLLRRAQATMDLLRQRFPGEGPLPALDFRLAAALRRAGRADEALALWRPYAPWALEDTWGQNARAELALARGGHEPPLKPTLVAYRTGRPPVFDGRLAEPAWSAPPTFLPPGPTVQTAGASGATTRPTAGAHSVGVRLLYDEESLYVAVEGQFIGEPGAAAARNPLGYGFGDRLEVALDAGRDYATHVCFTLLLPTERSQSINSTVPAQIPWRARASLGEDRFVAELAIPLRMLNVYAIDPDTVWGVNVAVTRQDGTSHRLSGAAPVASTPDFGYLLFSTLPADTQFRSETPRQP